MATVKVLSDFSESPGPRYCKQGPDSGEQFYHDILNGKFSNAFQKNEILTLDLDGTDGYMSSFIDEAIGNLVYDFGAKVVSHYLQVISNEETVWLKLIKSQIIPEWEQHRIRNEEPKKTSPHNHPAWIRLVNGRLEKRVWIHSI